MSTPTVSASIRVIAVLQRGPARETVRRVLEDEGMTLDVRDIEVDNVWRDTRSGHAVLVDDSLEPGDVAEALERGWIHGTAPLFVLAERLPPRDRYLAWLEAGAWDVLKVPLECAALAIRLRNILERGRAQDRDRSVRRYSLQTLEKVADEALALAQRYHRELYCVALGVDGPGHVEGEPIIERLADVAEDMVRGSDMVGLGDRRTLLILLPDSEEEGANAFMGRLHEALQHRLEEWEVAASLRTAAIAATEAGSGRELLSTAVRRLGV